MTHTAAQLVALVLIVVIVGAGTRLRYLRDAADRLGAELQHRHPVYSAETTRRKEAEFIRDRLPKRFPAALAIALLVLFAAAAWWLAR